MNCSRVRLNCMAGLFVGVLDSKFVIIASLYLELRVADRG